MTLSIAFVRTLYATYYTLLFTITNSGSSPGVNWLYHFNAPSGHTLSSFTSCFINNQGNEKYIVIGDGSTYSVPGSGGTVSFEVIFNAPSGYSSAAPNNAFLNSAPFGTPQILNVNATNVISTDNFDATWNPVQGAELYLIQIANNTEFTTDFYSYDTSDLEYEFSSLSPGTYYLQLLAGNRYGQTGWSAPLQVIAASPYIDIPALHLHSVVGNLVSIYWSSVSGATGYQLVQANDAGFTLNVVISDLPSTQHISSTRLPSGYYCFEVATIDGNTQSFYSDPICVTV